jgi:aryl-alcohol dehydrogenase-like predicted oxidoreductase
VEYRKLTNTDLAVSRLGLGTLTWGRDVTAPVARKLLHSFVSVGGNLIDTAPIYGSGMAERIIGSLMRHDVPREQLLIATKSGFSGSDTAGSDMRRETLLADLAGSLKRLGTDYVDIWQLHAWDERIDEALDALNYALSRGMTRAVGVCSFVGWQLGTAATMQTLSVTDAAQLTVASSEYSLLARGAEVELLPAAKYHGLGFFAWAPLGRGVLAGRYAAGAVPIDSRAASPGFEWYVEPYLNTKSAAVVDAITHAAEGLGMELPQVPLLWVRDAPGVSAVLLGARTPEQLQPYLVAEDQTLPDEIISALDDITGGSNMLRD